MSRTLDAFSDIDERLEAFFSSSESRWTKLYASEMQSAADLEEHIKRKMEVRQPILSHVRRFSPKEGRILESAAGTGSVALHLSKEGYECSTLELDPDMIALSQLIEEITGGSVERIQGSFLELPFEDDSFDTVFNHGVLEYFDEATIIKIIQEQLRVGRRFIFGVPTMWNQGTYIEVDENLWSHRQWEKIIRTSGAKIVDSYSYFSYRKVRAWINQVLGMNLQAVSPGVGFVLEKP